MSKEVILTGIRSNSELTLGNYLGAILPMVDMAKEHAGEYQINMFVPDLHSFTTPIDHTKLFAQTVGNVKKFMAAGLPIDHEDVYVYRQSYIPAHSELQWILSCFTGFGEASRMVEFKDKSSRLGDKRVSVGLFNYPILMAADILLYGAKWVPVGEDQRQHLELTRDLAQRLNEKFGDIFIVPNDLKEQQAFINRDSAPRIRSLKNPESKMSKSIDDPSGTILLSDNPKDAKKKVMSATTDSLGQINYNFDEQPGITNLLQILSLLTHRDQQDVNSEWVGRERYGELKTATANAVEEFLARFQENIANVEDSDVMHRIEQHEKVMREQTAGTLERVQKAVGLRPS